MCRGLSKSLERFCLRRCRPIVIIWVQDSTGILKKGTLKTECDMKGMTDFMKTLVQTDLLQEVANIHGVDKETVRCSIREAIAAARHTENDTARAFWDTLPDDATEVEIVLQIAKLLYTE